MVPVRNFDSRKIRTNAFAFPEYTLNPAVQKVVRVVFAVEGPAEGGPVSQQFFITPALLATTDQSDYGSSAIRYTRVRALNIRCYVGMSNLDPNCTLTIEDQDNVEVNELANPGATILSCGMQPGLARKMLPYATTDTTQLWVVTLSAVPDDLNSTLFAYVLCQFS